VADKVAATLSIPLQKAIWLQTSEGMDWSIDVSVDDADDQLEPGLEIPIVDSDIVEYLVSHVLGKAAEWQNARIRKYLVRDYLDE